MGGESQPYEEIESAGDQIDAMFEKAKDALMNAVIKKIKGGSDEDAKTALEDLLVFDRVSTTALHYENDGTYDLSAGQQQVDVIAQKYGLVDFDFSIEKFNDLARQVK